MTAEVSNEELGRPGEAVRRALALVGRGIYKLGTGNAGDHPDDPCDCFGLVCRVYGFRRHEPGFNVGPWASVSDDHNYNSANEDATHLQQHYEPVRVHLRDGDGQHVVDTYDIPRPGDLLSYPTIRLPGHDRPWIGHGAIVVAVPADWDWNRHTWADLQVVQCAGPNGRRPAILKATGKHWDLHDSLWGKPEHRSQLIRVRA